jgi:hypothetical protein
LVPLPTEQLVYPPFAELTKIIYGEPKTGKTTFCATAPDNFFVATEPGHDFIKAPVRRIFRWDPDPLRQDTRADFQSVVRRIYAMVEAGNFPYRMVTIDIL